ncbi:hypothetical protein NIES2135_61610 (plasmid) [Leptolyngbya boryana NIES-2135]|jgi:hypothetical protein|uniref:Uncharacterized protein n=1 Tax=Leptolyngbya boryana NIES-2135 TaxID=1973484 RepID=A0A1Z4JRF9_LEPBY|nr:MULTISPECIES: hypothetical protein [Leptolyngbya]BAY59284.1 hypothetical protein NIES2135_61610 [Leptolyngbya boryana NIES-2135]MBD2372872.1 hypothetical protein [Leptolyngbya sp. FACHB-238]MBD2397375.1 hypothetical protein [Leptolyngbya sp. FACHB-239]MBD2403820.1 hypothetical protein [Leptolyngbya sp. FACHB-402]ULP33476.1 hypothetical protein MCP04_30570 [Leptolyngbya boryana IU 594]
MAQYTIDVPLRHHEILDGLGLHELSDTAKCDLMSALSLFGGLEDDVSGLNPLSNATDLLSDIDCLDQQAVAILNGLSAYALTPHDGRTMAAIVASTLHAVQPKPYAWRTT